MQSSPEPRLRLGGCAPGGELSRKGQSLCSDIIRRLEFPARQREVKGRGAQCFPSFGERPVDAGAIARRQRSAKLLARLRRRGDEARRRGGVALSDKCRCQPFQGRRGSPPVVDLPV